MTPPDEPVWRPVPVPIPRPRPKPQPPPEGRAINAEIGEGQLWAKRFQWVALFRSAPEGRISTDYYEGKSAGGAHE